MYRLPIVLGSIFLENKKVIKNLSSPSFFELEISNYQETLI